MYYQTKGHQCSIKGLLKKDTIYEMWMISLNASKQRGKESKKAKVWVYAKHIGHMGIITKKSNIFRKTKKLFGGVIGAQQLTVISYGHIKWGFMGWQRALATPFFYSIFFLPPPLLLPPLTSFINFINFVRLSVCCISLCIQPYGIDAILLFWLG